MTEAQLTARLSFLEQQMNTAGIQDPKSMPALQHTYEKVLNELVRRDLGEPPPNYNAKKIRGKIAK